MGQDATCARLFNERDIIFQKFNLKIEKIIKFYINGKIAAQILNIDMFVSSYRCITPLRNIILTS